MKLEKKVHHINSRLQHAVGQGFFHSAELYKNERVSLRYIYDCGAMSRYSTELTSCIGNYLKDAVSNSSSKLDLLFISHVHADHLNGLPQLLDPNGGLSVDTIALPYFNMIERLIGYAQSVTVDPAIIRADFYREFVIDPVTVLSTFSPRQILFFHSSGPNSPGAPVDVSPEGIGPDKNLRDSEEKGNWRLVGRGHRDLSNHTMGSVPVSNIPDSMGILVPITSKNACAWLLSPFIDPMIEREQSIFKSALFNALKYDNLRGTKTKEEDFQAWLDDPDNLKELVVNKVWALKEAYEETHNNLNMTSMCLYSGPLPKKIGPPLTCHTRFGTWSAQIIDRIGWLATGDAALNDNKRNRAFLHHYQKLFDDVLTLTIPHHGSDDYFDIDLLTKIKPHFCVAAADAFGKWSHPGAKIVQGVASQGLFLSVVTSDIKSEIQESSFF